MRKTNWSNAITSAKLVKKGVKGSMEAAVFFNNFPDTGYMTDVKKDKENPNEYTAKNIKITEAKSSTLRRLIKSLENYYYLINDNDKKELVLAKKIELETELDSRPADEK